MGITGPFASRFYWGVYLAAAMEPACLACEVSFVRCTTMDHMVCVCVSYPLGGAVNHGTLFLAGWGVHLLLTRSHLTIRLLPACHAGCRQSKAGMPYAPTRGTLNIPRGWMHPACSCSCRSLPGSQPAASLCIAYPPHMSLHAYKCVHRPLHYYMLSVSMVHCSWVSFVDGNCCLDAYLCLEEM